MGICAIELFSGVGMLGEGLRAGLAHMGVAYRTVCHVEREAYACAVLAARMEEGSMDAAPIWSDVCTFDAQAWHGRVDCIVAGFPCQDLSVAGRRAGLNGKRSGLFFEVVRIATDSGAWLMLLENVGGIASASASVVDETEGELDERAAARVVGELADLGWDAEWITLSASDVGASHGRARWFCLAWRGMDDAKRTERRSVGAGIAGAVEGHDAGGREAHGRAGIASEVLADAGCRHVRRIEPLVIDRRSDQASDQLDGATVADAGSTGSQGHELGRACDGHGRGSQTHGSASQLRGLFALGPSDPKWAGILAEHPELAPALKPNFFIVVNGLAFDMDDSRAARLKCIGNGVVAAQAGCAVVLLARRAGLWTTRAADA